MGAATSGSGEAIRAFVVLPQASTLTEHDVIRACRDRLETFMVPHEVVFRTELPDDRVGKVRKKSLGEEGAPS